MLCDRINEYTSSGVYPMHMPGHKRNTELLQQGLPYELDVSEIHGFDSLNDPQGILKETAQIAADIYGSDKAFLLVNGATAGILAAIGAHAGYGEKILVARNCHLSVYNAIALFGLEPAYIVPDTDEATGIMCSVDPSSVESALRSNKDIKLVVVTSPTYEGVVSDIGSIAAIAHKWDIPLLVDGAHGAHLGFSGQFPASAINEGADVAVMSLHKTLPTLTQCALLHVCGTRADACELSRLLAVFQTTSPSYVLMASIDRCLRLLSSDKDKLFYEYERNLGWFSLKAESLRNLSVLCKGNDNPHPGFFAFDPGKIVAVTKKTALSGFELADILREVHKIEMEMACADYSVALTSICDTADGFSRLANALASIDRSSKILCAATVNEMQKSPLPVQAETPYSALKRRGRFIPPEDSIGLVSLEYIWAYPPGIPIIAPGEVIDAEIVSYVRRLIREGANLKSTRGRLPELIYAAW